MKIRCGRLVNPAKNEVLDDRVIEIVDGEIAHIGSRNNGKYDFDCSEMTVMPGIIDCHDHLGLDVTRGDEKEQSLDAIAHIAIVGARAGEAFLKSGITTLRDLSETDFVDVAWRRAFHEGLLQGPRLLIAGQCISRTGGHSWYCAVEINGVDDAVAAVRKQVKAGVDVIKFMATGGMSTEGSDPRSSELSREEMVAIVREAHRAGKKVSAHAHGGQGIDFALDAGADTIEHGVFASDEQLQRMSRQGTWLVVTYGIMPLLLNHPAVPGFVKSKIANSADGYKEVIRKTKKFAVNVAFGGDTYHARPWDEIAVLMETGYTPMEALKAATIDAARCCGIDDFTGSIEEGKSADLVIYRENPLENMDTIQSPVHVFKQGRCVCSHGRIIGGLER